jgi:hypothetical protein
MPPFVRKIVRRRESILELVDRAVAEQRAFEVVHPVKYDQRQRREAIEQRFQRLMREERRLFVPRYAEERLAEVTS